MICNTLATFSTLVAIIGTRALHCFVVFARHFHSSCMSACSCVRADSSEKQTSRISSICGCPARKDRMVASAIFAASSLGEPYTPVEMAGKARLFASALTASSRECLYAEASKSGSPAAPPCQTGPTVWITHLAASLQPLVILASPVAQPPSVRHSASNSARQRDGWHRPRRRRPAEKYWLH